MFHLQLLGSIAAFMNAAVMLAALAVAVVLIGVPAMSDPSKLAALALQNPAPLLIQDGFKLVSGVISVVLILALANYLQRDTPSVLSAATGFGLLSVFCLGVNAVLSLYAISQAAALEHNPGEMGNRLNVVINSLAMAVLIFDGVWHLLLSWAALKFQGLPKPLCYLGLGIGAFSLVPPLEMVVLPLTVVWLVWIGRVLLQERQTEIC